MTIQKELELRFASPPPPGGRSLHEEGQSVGRVVLPASTPFDTRVPAADARFGLVVKVIPLSKMPIHLAWWAWAEKGELVLRVLNTSSGAALEACDVKFQLIATEN